MTAKKLLIHIGHNKTGTTAIQNALSWQDLCQKIKQSKTDHLLISSEYLFQPLTAASFSKLNHMLRDAADQTEVIAYVRDPSTYILSLLHGSKTSYNQYLNTSMETSPSTYSPVVPCLMAISLLISYPNIYPWLNGLRWRFRSRLRTHQCLRKR